MHKVLARMTAVRMVQVLDTADTAPARRAVEWCKSPWIPLVNKAFLGSAVPERPSCIIPAAARHRFGSPARRQTGRFCGVDGTVPEKGFLPDAAGKASLCRVPVLLLALAMPAFSEAHADKDSFITT